MFKTGGPIKEGIMFGMKDRPQQLVTPNADGSRPGYAGPGLLALPYLGAAARFLARPFGQFVKRNIYGGKPIVKFGKDGSVTRSSGVVGTKNIFEPTKFGKYLAESPEGRLLVGGSGLAGKTGKTIFKAGKSLAKSPLTVAAGVYYGGGALLPDGTPDPNDPKNQKPAGERGKSGAPGGGDPDMFLTPQGQEGEGTPTLTANEQREALKKKYYDIMEIDKLSKRATGDALIAASQDLANLNREGITLKEGLRSGDLQSRLIASASKAFDKPAKTKDAIDAAILKAEITKDINREKDDLDRRVKESTLAVRKKQLEGDTFEEVVADATIKGNAPKGKTLATLFRAKTGNDATVIDSTQIPQGVDEEVFLSEQIEIARKEDKPTPPGYYVISGSIFLIDEQGNVSRRL
jgi:hypothetical protein